MISAVACQPVRLSVTFSQVCFSHRLEYIERNSPFVTCKTADPDTVSRQSSNFLSYHNIFALTTYIKCENCQFVMVEVKILQSWRTDDAGKWGFCPLMENFLPAPMTGCGGWLGRQANGV